tara:strand:+ start:1563 stop:2435 length:873 start_codon:yes stop_codon:yes gene_type:complete
VKVVAVTGAGSMLGEQLCAILIESGVTVIRVGRDTDAEINLDLRHGLKKAVKSVADVLFHCAAGFGDDSPEGVRANFEINAAGCLHVLELADRLNCRSVVGAGTLSSCEKFEPGSMTSYGLSKAQGESLLQWGMMRRGGKFCALRFPQLFDTNGRSVKHQAWFGRVVTYAGAGLDLNLPASEGPRNFLHVEDAARLMLTAGQRGMSGVYSVVHQELINMGELAELAFGIFGRGGTARISDVKKPFRRVNYPKDAGMFQALDISPAISLREGLARIRDAGTESAFGPLDVT